jgi:O-antigen/teichoic acid export membrane protein
MSLRHFRTVIGGDAMAKVLTAVFVLGLVRFLPAAGLASFVHLSSIVILSTLLLGGFFNRLYILQGSKHVPVQGFRRMQVGSASLAYCAAIVVVRPDAPLFDIAAGLVCTAAAATFDFSRTWLQSTAQFTRYATADVVRAAALLLLVVPVLFEVSSHHAGAVLLAQAAAFLLGTLTLPPLPREQERTQPSLAAMAKHLFGSRGALALIGYFALVALFGQLPVILVERLADTHALASFGSAYRYYGLLLGIVVAANVVILPRVAGAREGDLPASLRSALRIIAVALALVLLAGIAGYIAIPLIDGGKYPRAPMLFVTCSLGLLPGLVAAPLVAMCLRSDQFGRLFVSQLLSLTAAVATVYAGRADPALAAAASLPVGVLVQLAWLGATLRPRPLGALH